MGFFDRLKNVWKIFKLSFVLLKKDKSLIFIPAIMLLSLPILFFIFWRLYYVFSLGLFIFILLSLYVNGAYYTILYLTLIEKKKIKNLQISF